MKSYDGTFVRVSEDKIDDFKEQQEKIKKLLENGKTPKEIITLIKEGEL